MKKIFLILSIVIAFALSVLSVNAKSNQLHTLTLEKISDGYNIVLDTDELARVNKKVISNDEIVLELSGITTADTVNALYKGVESIDNLVVEKSGLNKVKVYVTAPNIKFASVIMQPFDGEGTLVGESFPWNKVLWSVFVLIALIAVAKRSIRKTNDENSLLIKRDIKDREIALYRQYRRSLEDDVCLRTKDKKMQNMLKKIDRKIDERLSLIK